MKEPEVTLPIKKGTRSSTHGNTSFQSVKCGGEKTSKICINFFELYVKIFFEKYLSNKCYS
jgi:hypothetical protein